MFCLPLSKYVICYIHPINGNRYFLRSFVFDGFLKPVGVFPYKHSHASVYSKREADVWVAYLISIGYDAWSFNSELSFIKKFT